MKPPLLEPMTHQRPGRFRLRPTLPPGHHDAAAPLDDPPRCGGAGPASHVQRTSTRVADRIQPVTASLLFAILLSVLVGLSLGLLGGGGSILAMPVLVYVAKLEVHAAIGVSLAV